MTRAVAVIDGEHYPDVVRQALAELRYDVCAAVLVGGKEKLRGGESYGVPLAPTVEQAVAEHGPEIVVDLSDEPVLGPRERFRLASRVLALGLPYVGADFRLDPPVFSPLEVPSIAVIGTGKRVGKTAVTGTLARVAAETRDVVVVSMGRGGPPEPEVVERPPTVDELVARSRAGAHAASDYLETAVVAGVVTVGCRRCGGGLAGETWISNVREGLVLAAARRPDLVVCDGSGAALPPVAADARVLVASALQGADTVTGYLNAYRILISDLVVVTMADGGARAVAERIREVKEVPVIACDLRLRPLEPLLGRRTAVFTAGPAATAHLDAEVVHASANLADRAALRDELARSADAEVYLVEIKAAGIDVVAETARRRRAHVIFADNEPVPQPGEPDLESALRSLVQNALKEPVIA